MESNENPPPAGPRTIVARIRRQSSRYKTKRMWKKCIKVRTAERILVLMFCVIGIHYYTYGLKETQKSVHEKEQELLDETDLIDDKLPQLRFAEDHLPVVQVFNGGNRKLDGGPPEDQKEQKSNPIKKSDEALKTHKETNSNKKQEHKPSLVKSNNQTKSKKDHKPALEKSKKVPRKPVIKYRNSPAHWLGNINTNNNVSDEITVVTAYINIGKLSGKQYGPQYSPEKFHEWMQIFSKIRNPVVVYMNDRTDMYTFNNIRNKLTAAKSKVIPVFKQDLWAFSLGKDMKNISSRSDNKALINHNLPIDFISTLQARYEFMAMALKENPFKTKYFAWLDMGLFKDIADHKQFPFSLGLPTKFDENKVAYSEMYPWKNYSVPLIFQQSKVWVSGSSFIAKASVMKKLVNEFITYAELYTLRHFYINTDAQILYAMFQKDKKISVAIQAYPAERKYELGTQLAYIMKERGKKKPNSGPKVEGRF